MEMKTCSRCKLTKPATADFFYCSSYERSGLIGTCKVCFNEIKKNKRKDPEYRRIENEKRKQYRETHKEQITAYRKANQEKINKQHVQARKKRALARYNEPKSDG